MTLKLYHDLMSQPARAVYMFLKATGISYVDCPIALRKAEHLSEEYAKVTPFKKVPVIDDNGFVLTESVAILKYLAVKYNVDDHWYPKDIQKQARVDEYMNWQHLNLRAFGAQYFMTRVLGGKPVDEKRLQRFKTDLDKCLDQIEQIFLRNSPFINGANDISIADLLAVAEIEQPIGANYDVLANRPILTAYMKRVRDRLSPPLYDNAHVFIRKVRENIIKGKL